MKLIKITITVLALLLISPFVFSQDQRTIETRVADLLSRLPANDNTLTAKLMGDMMLLGDAGIRQICSQVVPAGAGDDTNARFAIESYSRFLSAKKTDKERLAWEKVCIEYVDKSPDNTLKDFFMKQLQLTGGEASVEAMKGYLSRKENCEPALAVILASGAKNAEDVLAASLKNRELPCVAGVMNALAAMNSDLAVNEYIEWSGVVDVNTRAAALNALARSGSPDAYDVLLKAAEGVNYGWEHTGATSSLLNYAEIVGGRGDIKTMDRITNLVIKKCKEDASIQNKSAALGIYTKFHGIDAMPLLYKAASHDNKKYRTAAMRFSLGIPGTEVVQNWIVYFRKADDAAKPELIAMFGERGDARALPLVNSALADKDQAVRMEAAASLAKLSGNEAISALVTYLMAYDAPEDQKAAKDALMTVMRNEDIRFLLPVLKSGTPAAKKTSIELLAWKKDSKYFKDVLDLASSSDEKVKAAAISSLGDLVTAEDQQALIDLLLKAENPAQAADLQKAVANAAGKIQNPEQRAGQVIKALASQHGQNERIRLIPVLAKTGGREALSIVLKEFENGNPDMRDASFRALTGWCDWSASSALYQIAASGNKTYEGQAVGGYLRQVRSAGIPDEQKYLLLRKIMPYALSAGRKNAVLTDLSRLKTYPSLYYVSGFLDDPATSAAAARAAMTIALPAANAMSGMYGTLVRDILTKAAGKLTGPESEYDREMVNKYLLEMPPDEGFRSMFNGSDLTGWKGLVEDPVKRAKMKPSELAKKQLEADKKVPLNWSVKDGCIYFNGKGNNLCSVEQYADFEMLVDWKISKEGDSGIYLRGTPQVQIWDTSRTEVGAQVGSGGLYNNKVNPKDPIKVADNPVGEWNSFRIVMVGDKVSVWLNGEIVVDNVTMENYWDRSIPIFPREQVELQAHGTDLAFRDIYIREISDQEYSLTPEERSEGFVSLFNGKNLDNWIGNKGSYVVEDANIVVKPGEGSGGNLYTEKEYADFIFRFEFQLTPAANNGLGIRAPLTGDAAYGGMELQILDDTAPVYASLQPYQYHGSVYGVIPAKKGSQRPVGEWNYQEVTVRGTKITVVLNGNIIVDGDIAGPRDNGTMDHRQHPGLKNEKGHIGFLGHGSELKFRNIRIKDLSSIRAK